MKKARKSVLVILCLSMILSMIFAMPVNAAGKKKSKKLEKGTSVWFGNYEQNDIDDGLEPIEWIVVEDKNDTLLLMSKYLLDKGYYGADCDDYSWKNSNVRRFCNGQFYNTAFTSEEKKSILNTKVKDFFGDTKDKVYIFSEEEIYKYFSSKKDEKYLKAYVTNYAFNNGLYCTTYKTIELEPKMKKFHGKGQWLLRGPEIKKGKVRGGVLCVTSAAYFVDNDNAADQEDGIRPVIRVKKSAVKYKDKSGKDTKLYIFKNVDKKKSKKVVKAPEKLVLSGNRDEFFSSENYSYIETERYVIFLDKNVRVRGNLVEDINEIISATEEHTGMSLYPNGNKYWSKENSCDSPKSIGLLYFGEDVWNGVNTNNEKFSIFILGQNDEKWTSFCPGSNEVVCVYDDMDFYDENVGIYTFVHEITHSLQEANSPHLKETADKFCEGYAAYTEITVGGKLSKYPSGKYKSFKYMPNENLDIKKQDVEKYFDMDFTKVYGLLNSEEYEYGYALVKYMIEQYSSPSFIDYLDEIEKLLDKSGKTRVSTSIRKQAIKNLYGEDFFDKFGEWYEKYNDEEKRRFRDIL